MKFYRNADIENIAEAKLAEFSKMLGRPLTPPIPIDLMAGKLYNINILWDTIEEEPGEMILGGLNPEERVIVINEKHRKQFEEKPGMERSTIGHEMGHWELFLSKGVIGHPALPGMARTDSFVQRNSTGKRSVEVIKALIASEPGREILRNIHARSDERDEARAVNRFAAAISMPRDLIRAEALKIDRTQWPNLYRLAEKFDVTISALTVRLQQLNLLSVSKDGKKLFGSPDEAAGQMGLGLE